jgi:hypothetical protein
MAAEFKNVAKDHAQVGSQNSVVYGPVSSYVAGQQGPDATLLLDQLAELRQAVVAAQQRGELTAEESASAQAELDVARSEVDAAASGRRDGLWASLGRLLAPLARAVDLLSKLAQIAQAVQGLR